MSPNREPTGKQMRGLIGPLQHPVTAAHRQSRDPLGGHKEQLDHLSSDYYYYDYSSYSYYYYRYYEQQLIGAKQYYCHYCHSRIAAVAVEHPPPLWYSHILETYAPRISPAASVSESKWSCTRCNESNRTIALQMRSKTGNLPRTGPSDRSIVCVKEPEFYCFPAPGLYMINQTTHAFSPF